MVTLSVLAQLDIISTASDGALRAIPDVVDPFVFRLSIFVLAVFVHYVVWSVTRAAYGLMSVTNAISVIVVGALLAVGVAGETIPADLGARLRLRGADLRLSEYWRLW
jgi:NAD/NADP transhydrogenase alpha subunit